MIAFQKSPTVDAVMAAERAASFTKRSIKNAAKLEGYKLALSMLDLTTLEGKDSAEKARSLARKALCPDPTNPALPTVAAVCVYPAMVSAVKAELSRAASNHKIKIASVATGFPSGQFPLDVKLADVRDAINAGADEIDMVINRGDFLSGNHAAVADEIRAVKEVCVTASHPVALKVILETGELETLDNVRIASDLSIRAMADIDDQDVASTRKRHAAGYFDFIKTSTGKVTPAATMPVTLVMLEAIRDWYLDTGRFVGMKPAGGIRTAKQSLHYLVMVNETLGHLTATRGGDGMCPWLTPELFRFGASTLTNDILRQIRWLETGKYQSAHDFSEA